MGLRLRGMMIVATPLGLKFSMRFPQGSACRATLGFETKSLRDLILATHYQRHLKAFGIGHSAIGNWKLKIGICPFLSIAAEPISSYQSAQKPTMAQDEFQFEGSSDSLAAKKPGRRHLRRPWGVALACLLVAIVSVVLIIRHYRFQHLQDGVIVAAAHRYDMPPALIKAVVWQESRFNPRAHGKADEVGLMQISKLAAQEWATSEGLGTFDHRQLFNPAQNTLAGAWYLKKLLRRYANTDLPMAYALADYNAGRSNVLRWTKGPAATQSAFFIEQIDFPSTKEYVQSVLRRYEHYQKAEPKLGASRSSPG
jgi:soluble lytic murein transglycosylase